MTDRGLAIKIKKTIPAWDWGVDNFYAEAYSVITSGNRELIENLVTFVEEYPNTENIINELNRRIKI